MASVNMANSPPELGVLKLTSFVPGFFGYFFGPPNAFKIQDPEHMVDVFKWGNEILSVFKEAKSTGNASSTSLRAKSLSIFTR